MNRWVWRIGFATTGIVAGGGLATAIILPQALKAKNALENFVQIGGPENNLRNTEKINYVALGDSFTAGYNGFMGKDYVSFADFLMNDLKKAGRLGGYRNFSKSGDMIWDLEKQLTENTGVIHSVQTFSDEQAKAEFNAPKEAIEGADLITISIGGNDLFKYAKLLELPFSTLIGGQEAMGLTKNSFREAFAKSFAETTSSSETWYLVEKSIEEFQTALSNGDFGSALSLQPKLLDTAYDLINRNLAMMLTDINILAPDAHVIVVTPPMPFVDFPPSLLNTKIEENHNMSPEDFYAKFVEKEKNSADFYNYVDFVNGDDIPMFKDNKEKVTINGIERLRKLPNAGDIHPSTYGHELLGNGLFKKYAESLFGIKYKDSYLTHAIDSNGDNIASSVDANGDFAPELYDESGKDEKDSSGALITGTPETGISYKMDDMVREILSIDKDNAINNDISIKLSNNLDKLLDLFIGGESEGASYQLDPVGNSALITSTDQSGNEQYGLMDSLMPGGDIMTFINEAPYYFKKLIVNIGLIFNNAIGNQSLLNVLKTNILDFKAKNLFNKEQFLEIQNLFSDARTSFHDLKINPIIDPSSASLIYYKPNPTDSTKLERKEILASTYGCASIKELNYKFTLSYYIDLLTSDLAFPLIFAELGGSNMLNPANQDHYNSLRAIGYSLNSVYLEEGMDEMVRMLKQNGVESKIIDGIKSEFNAKEKEVDASKDTLQSSFQPVIDFLKGDKVFGDSTLMSDTDDDHWAAEVKTRMLAEFSAGTFSKLTTQYPYDPTTNVIGKLILSDEPLKLIRSNQALLNDSHGMLKIASKVFLSQELNTKNAAELNALDKYVGKTLSLPVTALSNAFTATTRILKLWNKSDAQENLTKTLDIAKRFATIGMFTPTDMPVYCKFLDFLLITTNGMSYPTSTHPKVGVYEFGLKFLLSTDTSSTESAYQTFKNKFGATDIIAADLNAMGVIKQN